ncbi:MAG: amidohydrolase [Candidatus Latescibacterota bacterium]
MRGIIILFSIIFYTVVISPPVVYSSDQQTRMKQEAVDWINANSQAYEAAAKVIHGYAETSLREYKSSETLAGLLEKGGFKVERGVAGMPTAFVAVYGSGRPVVGILAEYDALPGLSQKPFSAIKEPVVTGGAGHGCGHNLFGAGSIEAALALKTVMEKNKLSGTIKLFGCPAEETLIGKIYMAKAGIFEGLDVCLNWHPSGENKVDLGSNRAMNSFEVIFHGKTAHAAGDPWDGRSALDAVELMDTGVNFLREHVKETVRIHYSIMDGGKAPNIVPDYARVWYFVRDSSRQGVEEVYARVLKCAEGAALMTGTTMEVKMITGGYNYLPNRVISEVVYKNLQTFAPQYTPEEQAFARSIQKTLGIEEKGLKTKVEPFEETKTVSGGSTDASDVSWLVPMNGEMGIATNPEGAPGHSWAVASSCGSSVGFKGMNAAAKVLAASALDILFEKNIIEKAKSEFAEKTKEFTYKNAIPDGQKPPLPEDK